MLSYSAPAATVQQVLKSHGHKVEDTSCSHVKKVLRRLSACRTSALGFHLYRCTDDSCGHVKYQYHSCRARSRLKRDGALKQDEWIQAFADACFAFYMI